MDRLALKKTNKEPAALATVNPNFEFSPAGLNPSRRSRGLRGFQVYSQTS